jgi:integrase
MKQIEDGIFERKDRKGFFFSYVDAQGKRRKKKSAAQNITQARMARNAMLAKVEQAKLLGIIPPGAETFEEVTRRYLKYQAARVTKASQERLDGIVTLHLVPFFNRPVASIRRNDVQKYVTQRSPKASAASVTKELATLKHILSLCVEWEIIPFNPAQGVKAPKLPPGRSRYLQPDELKVIVEFCPEWLRPIVLFAVHTGMRRGEILRTRWIDLDHAHSLIILSRTKNGEARVVSLNKSALDVIEMLPRGGPLERLFPGVRADYLTGAFKRACGHAEIEDFHFHDLRHTFGSWARMKGVDSQSVGVLMGHKDPRMAARYQHLNSAFLAEAVAVLDDVFADSMTILRPPSVPAFPDVENPSLIN